MKNCFDYPSGSACGGVDMRMTDFLAALGRIHAMPPNRSIVPHDYVSMAAALREAYDSQPIKFYDDWRVMSFMSGHARQLGQWTECVVLSSEAFRQMSLRGTCAVDLSAPRCRDLSLGNPLFDMTMAVALDFPFDQSLHLLQTLTGQGAEARDLLWFAWRHLVSCLVATVATCDETAINSVQRRITSFTSFAAAMLTEA